MFITIATTLAVLLGADPVRDRAGEEFFESKIRPILVDHCGSCHGDKKQSGGLRLDAREAIVKGGDSGPAAITGKPVESRMIAAIRHEGELKMPPKQPLSKEQIAALTEWVERGMPWPQSRERQRPEDSKPHWAFQPVQQPPVPQSQYGTNPIDAFIRSKLAAANLAANPQADRATLIRRLTFDLHGLPPTPQEVEAFVQDRSADAYEKLVERLLASPRYGERWGRHWLDVARYADTKGYFFEGERRYPYAYTYRDYVIKAFNDDKPYDQFVREQLAADRLTDGEDKSTWAALGFLTVGRRFLNNVPDIIDDRIDVVTRGFLGLTVSCARCHDHKYDPIPTQDYYSLYGIFANATEPNDLPFLGSRATNSARADYDKELSRRESELNEHCRVRHEALHVAARLAVTLATKSQSIVTANCGFAIPTPAVDRDRLDRTLQGGEKDKLRKLVAAVEEHRHFSPNAPPRAMAVCDAQKITEQKVFLRGNPSNLGPTVPRRFPAVLSSTERREFKDGSGRLELANAITDPNNPLTARVMVNRVWMHHFGAGLVTTLSDFGTRSGPPSHPELLDWLATQFINDGWSIKQLHRRIVTSSTYRQSAAECKNGLAVDPENRLLWRFPRRRLEFEALRDAMLSVAGLIDLTTGGPSVDLTREPFTHRRTVYGMIERQNLPGVFRTFDFANPDMHSPMRFTTTVPQQGLYLMNSAFVSHVAQQLMQRREIASALTFEERIDTLFRLLLSRPPRSDEVDLARRFVDNSADARTAWERFAQALLLTNEFAFVD